jgi:hypothetical protein
MLAAAIADHKEAHEGRSPRGVLLGIKQLQMMVDYFSTNLAINKDEQPPLLKTFSIDGVTVIPVLHNDYLQTV